MNIKTNYSEICDIISLKYGKGVEKREWKFPYSENYGDFATAVHGGYANISTRWYKTNYITASIISFQYKYLLVLLVYASESLSDKARLEFNEIDIKSF